jgi:hypothetical protein
MKRRPFLKSLAAGGAAVSLAPAVTACQAGETGRQRYQEGFKTVPDYERTLLISQDNDHLSVKFFSPLITHDIRQTGVMTGFFDYF